MRSQRLRLIYDDNAYVEGGGGAPGPMGRQVAGEAFLEAYLSHGRFAELAALVGPGGAAALAELWRDHPVTRGGARTLRVLERGKFHQSFFPDPPATIVHSPQPPDPKFAWARQQAGPHAFALSGVTHTLSTPEAVGLLHGLVTAPFESYDALICTSRAVASMVREITGAYTDHLRGRLGGSWPARRSADHFPVRLETIPLGVDLDRFHPASPAERAAARQSIGVSESEVAILFVGRLSHHAKAHPFPMFWGASQAAVASGQNVRLILAGWTAHPAVHAAFLDGARTFAAKVRTSIVDGRDPETRRSVWHAADIFVSPSDNIQETFGLAVVEAMASGLPVVASDWNGYRDLVVDGETGFLISTVMVDDATVGATARLLIGDLTYDHFLAECSQAIAVDVPAMAAALTRLVDDNDLRRRMGDAGRCRAAQQFAWPRIIQAYEHLWARPGGGAIRPDPGWNRRRRPFVGVHGWRRPRGVPGPRANFRQLPDNPPQGPRPCRARAGRGRRRRCSPRHAAHPPCVRPACSGPGNAPCGHRPDALLCAGSRRILVRRRRRARNRPRLPSLDAKV